MRGWQLGASGYCVGSRGVVVSADSKAHQTSSKLSQAHWLRRMGSKGLRAIQDLYLCVFTHAQHEDLVRWIQVESYIVSDLLD